MMLLLFFFLPDEDSSLVLLLLNGLQMLQYYHVFVWTVMQPMALHLSMLCLHV